MGNQTNLSHASGLICDKLLQHILLTVWYHHSTFFWLNPTSNTTICPGTTDGRLVLADSKLKKQTDRDLMLARVDQYTSKPFCTVLMPKNILPEKMKTQQFIINRYVLYPYIISRVNIMCTSIFLIYFLKLVNK